MRYLKDKKFGSVKYQIYPLGDRALTIELGKSIHLETHNAVMALYHHLRKNLEHVTDLIPAYASITVVYDPFFSGRSAFAEMKKKVDDLMHLPIEKREAAARLITVPVCYDQTFAMDAKRMEKLHQRSWKEITELHSKPIYTIFMLGFLPGFAYMGSVPKKIATPRLPAPRTHIPAGSVGIAGEQTGIYPISSPGGWNIIGMTPRKIFDPAKNTTTLFSPGDQIKFESISMEDFLAYTNISV